MILLKCSTQSSPDKKKKIRVLLSTQKPALILLLHSINYILLEPVQCVYTSHRSSDPSIISRLCNDDPICALTEYVHLFLAGALLFGRDLLTLKLPK